MELHKTSGIILSTLNTGESDVLCSILTRDHGKKKFTFKGLKKSRNRPKSAADPGTLLNMVYYFHEGREVSTINDFSVDEHFPGIRESLDRIYGLYYLLEVVDKTTGYGDINIRLFNLLRAGIGETAVKGAGILLPVFFTIHLLRIHGILQEQGSCRVCDSTSFSRFSLNISDLAMVCSDCRTDSSYLETESWEFLNESIRKKFSAIDQAKYSEKCLEDLQKRLILFIENYFSIELKSAHCIQSFTG